MKSLLIWIIVLTVIFFLARLKVGIWLLYEKKKFQWKLSLAGLRFSPSKAKKKKPSPEPEPSKAANKKKKKKLFQSPLFRAVMESWHDILALVGRILKTPTLDLLFLDIQAGGSDAEQCAMRYGQICAALGTVLPVLENTFTIRKHRINAQCCYEITSVEIIAEASITLRIYEIIALAAALLGLGIKILVLTRKNKAVQQYESSSS